MAESGSRRFRLIVFDWDGTLFDSTAIIARAIQSACDELGEPVPDDEAARYVIGMGLTDALRSAVPSLPVHRHAELATQYRKHYLALEDDIALFAGAEQMLDDLDAAGHLLAVATGKSRSGLDRVLTTSGLASRFSATRCGDEGFPKPHPDMLLHLMDRLGVHARDTLMIGDTTHDLELARNAGVAGLAVGYGAHAPQALVRLAPLAIVHSVAELRAWLASKG
ncbi:MAG: HAD-IA family hydrolase [Burkholderiales bacterium]|nr:HAD-IA family hydrolase [Burkholderiales bacterium]